MRILILEDEDYRIDYFYKKFFGHQIDVTKIPAQACKFLDENTYDVICIDHDLQPHHYDEGVIVEESKTGLLLGNYLGKNLHLSPKAHVIIHSMNPTGSERIRQACEIRNPVRIPFPTFEARIKLT